MFSKSRDLSQSSQPTGKWMSVWTNQNSLPKALENAELYSLLSEERDVKPQLRPAYTS